MSAASWIGVGLVLVVLCGVGAVHMRHTTRLLHIELEALRDRRDTLNMDWNRLELELSTLAAPGLVDRAARSRLGMAEPAADAIRYLRP